MIHRKKTVIVLSTVLIVCFAFFGLVAKFSLTAASENRKLEISSYEENIKTKESLLAKTYDKSDALQDEQQRTWREELVFMRAVVDGLNENNWEKRVQNKTRCLELELNEDNLITGVAEAQNELAFNKALMEYQAAPRDFAEDGVSSVYGLFKNWLFYLIPLCAMLLASDLISGERASGSVKLLMQRRKTRAGLYTRKFLSGLRWTSLAVLSAVLGAFAGGAVFGAGVGSLSYHVLLQSDYVQTWRIFLFCLPVVLLSVAFYTALGLFLSTLFRSGALSVIASTAGVSALVFFGRKTVAAAYGNAWQFSPFECGDALTAVLGKFSVPVQETLTNPATGQLTTIDSSYFADIPAALPLWGCALMLLGCSALFLVAGIWIFRRKDLV